MLNGTSCGLIHTLLLLLEAPVACETVSIRKRVIRLLGIVCGTGILPTEAKRLLSLLKEPSALSVSLLQSLKTMMKLDDVVAKACPGCFFNFGGVGSELICTDLAFPFAREYQIMCWFRIENFALVSSENGKQVIVSFSSNPTGNGVSVYIEDKVVNVTIYDQSAPNDQGVLHHVRITDAPLRRGCWYNLSVKHWKPRISFFSKDELVVSLDHQVVFQDAIKFPNMSSGSTGDSVSDLCTLKCGLNFDGQMGPVYFLNEALPANMLEVLGKTAGGRAVESALVSAGGVTNTNSVSVQSSAALTVDMAAKLTLSREGKSAALQAKMEIVLHPARCRAGFAFDIHGRVAAKFGPNVHVWELAPLREVLISIGGIAVLLPLWPYLLVEQEEDVPEESPPLDTPQSPTTGLGNMLRRRLSANSIPFSNPPLPDAVDAATQRKAEGGELGLGTSIADIYRDDDTKRLFSLKTLLDVDAELLEIVDDGVIGLLLHIFARCLRSHEVHQAWMIKLNGLELIEYALQCAPVSIMSSEGPNLVMALLQLRSSVKDSTELDRVLIGHLLCNFKIWCCGSTELQTSLMSVTIAAIRAQPDLFGEVVGVQQLLDYVSACYLDESEEDSELTTEYAELMSMEVISSLPTVTESVATPPPKQAPSTPLLTPTAAGGEASPTPTVGDGEEMTTTPVHARPQRRRTFKMLLTSALGFNEEDAQSNAHTSERRPSGMAVDGDMQNFQQTQDTESMKRKARCAEIAKQLREAKAHRNRMRGAIYEMINIIALQNCREKDVRPIIDFIGDCKDLLVMNEAAQLLLCLVVEGGARTVTAIIEACRGADEFGAFVLFHFLNKAVEDVRCSGVRLLTHFYMRTDGLPTHLVNMTTRAAKTRKFVTRAFDAISTAAGNESQHGGLNRMAATGGLLLLTEFMLHYSDDSTTENSYMALLEMLLTRSESSIHTYMSHSNRLESDPWADPKEVKDGLKLPTPDFSKTVGHRSVLFTANLMHPDLASDESIQLTNNCILPVFFTVLPKLPQSSRGRVYGDLLALLKHGVTIRQAFVSKSSWHICMFELMAHLIVPQTVEKYNCISSHMIPAVLNKWSVVTSGSGVPLRGSHESSDDSLPTEYAGNRFSSTFRLTPKIENSPLLEKVEKRQKQQKPSFHQASDVEKEDPATLDLNFAIGMKITATLLLHSLEIKGGWREILFTLGQSHSCTNGVSVSQAVLSQVLSELTFTMKSKYRNLQHMAKSTNTSTNNAAMTKLENLLSLILICGLFTIDAPTSSMNLPHYDIAKKRAEFIAEVKAERAVCKFHCSDALHGKCLAAVDLCPDCGHSLSVHPVLSTVHEEAEIRVRKYVVEGRHGRKAPTIPVTKETASTTPKPAGSSLANIFNDLEIPTLDEAECDYIDSAVQSPSGTAKEGTWGSVRSVLGMRSMTGSLGSYKSTESKGGGNGRMDLSHCWFDLSLNNGNPPEGEASTAVDGNTPKKKSLVIHDDELIRPIERNYGHVRATLVLTLQNLRFFDAIFWPHTDAGMRNISMLKYQNDFGLPSSLGGATTTLTYTNTTSNMFSASTNSAAEHFSSMTLYSSALRMSLFVLQELSPFSDLAELNLRRLRILVSYIDKVPSFAFSTEANDDWALVVVVQVTATLQRIASALGPVFDLIFADASSETRARGSFCPPHVVGTADDEEAAGGTKNVAADELDAALGKPEARSQLECLFNNDAGRRLIAFIRSSVHLLVDCVEMKRALLLKALPEQTFVALATLVAVTKNDTLRRNDHSVGFSSPNPSMGSPVMFGGSPGGPSTRITGEYVFSNNLYANSVYVAEGEVAIDTLFDKHHAKKESFASMFKGAANAESVVGRRESTANTSGPTTPPPTTPLSVAQSSDTLYELDADSDDEDDIPEPPKTRAATSSTAEEGVLHSSIHGDVTVVLRWLKCLYLESDILRGDMMVGAAMAIEQQEADALTYFQHKLNTFGHVVNSDAKEAGKTLQAEVSELTEVASNMSMSISSRETNRQLLQRNQDMDRVRHVASSWHSCLKQFELDWSPWKPVSAAAAEASAANIRREISSHSDSKLRRMMFTKLNEPVDHSNCAYLETKQKMNQMLGEVSDEEKTILIQLRRRLSGGEALEGSDMSAAASAASKKKLKKKTGVLGATVQSQEEFWGDVYDVQTAEEDAVRLKIASGSEGAVSNLGTMFSSAKEEKRPAWTRFFPWAPDEKVLLSVNDVCDIKAEQIVEGTLLLTSRCLYFQPKKRQSGLRPNPKPEVFKTCCWHVNRITEMYGRRYLLQNCAIELFHLDSTETLFAFNSSSELAVFFRVLRKQLSVPLISTPTMLAPKLVFAQSQWTDLWRRRIISNFEYLMHINKISGRSYNDLTQYPVMPWVLADYKSKNIDFSSMTPGTVFRDLTRPVGALNPDKLREIMERYNTFDVEEEKFMYGSHYSSAGVCMYFLIRQEPFTTLSIALQGGRFDCPDRLFFDLSSTWAGVQNSMSDVKELIPEMYCFPECLINSNRLPLGELQTLNEDGELVSDGEGQVVDHVVLPDWCNNDPYEFIRLHREALESEYVSMNLHHWVDLIFGVKQKGQAAIDAYNVFYYLTYENALSTGIDSIEDDLQREAIKAQVTHFGQTPSQLFSKPHPQRVPCSEVPVPLCSKIQALHDLVLYSLPAPKQFGASGEHGSVISITIEGGDKLVVVYADLSVGTYRWSTVPDYQEGSLYQVRPDKIRRLHPSSPSISSLPADCAESFHLLLPSWPVDTKVMHHSYMSTDSDDSGGSGSDVVQLKVTSPTNSSMFGRMMGASSSGVATTTSPNKSSSWWGGRGRSASVASPVTGSTTPPPVVSNRHSISLSEVPASGVRIQRPRPQSVAITGSKTTPNRRTLSGLFADAPDEGSSTEDAGNFAPLSFSVSPPLDGIDGSKLSNGNSTQRSVISIEEVLANRVGRDDDDGDGSEVSAKRKRSVGLLYREFMDGDGCLGAPSRNVLDQVRGGRSVAICGAMTANNNSVPVLLSCGYWDNSIRVNNMDSSLKEIGNVTKGHLGQVTAICSCTDNTSINAVQTPLTNQFSLVVTGGVDGTCRVWVFDFDWYNNSSSAGTSSSVTAISSLVHDLTSPGMGVSADVGATSSPLTCIHILWGHDTPITNLCYSSTADLVVSVSATGLICMHTARKGTFLRSIPTCVGRVVNEVYIAPGGYIVVFSSTMVTGECPSTNDSKNKNGMTLHVFWLNGELLCSDHDIESRLVFFLSFQCFFRSLLSNFA